MSYPIHPDTIIIKNNFYPLGLTEVDIYNYYNNNKNIILQETEDRKIMFFIFTELNKYIIFRKRDDNFIYLNHDNYDKYITGRTLSIHSNMNALENFGIVDIDCKNFNNAKEATFDTYNYILNKISFINKIDIRFTGKTSFHLICHLTKKSNINSIRLLLEKFLKTSPLHKKYEISYKGKAGDKPILDLSPNKLNGSFITLHSLSIIGLKCMNITIDQLYSFKKEYAKI